jgi:hypothetical protein
MSSPTDAAIDNAIAGISEASGSALKELLETKHLYQKVQIPADSVIKEARKSTYNACLIFDQDLALVLKTSPNFILSSNLLRLMDRSGAAETCLTLIIKNVKLFCNRCQSKEAFRPVWYKDLANEIARHDVAPLMRLPKSFQIFFLIYECQACPPGETTPEAFLVRRTGWELFLEGRSPMETVPVESFIPKEERAFFRDAVIAKNSGKTLAGLFYLRTFIEQYARRKVNISERLNGDELLSKYADTIPLPQRDQMPSLREWYDKLSDALHSAKEDAVLFDQAKQEIERHFDFRRLFHIS